MATMWYYTEQGKQQGPVAEEELYRMAKEKKLQPTDLVWKDGMPEWVAASTVDDLCEKEAPDPESAPTPTLKENPVTGADETEQRPVGEVRSSARDAPDERRRERGGRRRRGAKRSKSTAGLMLGMSALTILLLGCLIGVPLVIYAFASNTFSASLPPGGQFTRQIYIPKNSSVTIRLTSRIKSEMQLSLYKSRSRRIAIDVDKVGNCHIREAIKDGGMYRIEVRNASRFGAVNHCTITYKIRPTRSPNR